jgi:transposase
MEVREMNYIGVDFHKHYSQVTVLDEKGKVLSRERIENTQEAVATLFEGLEKSTMAVMEVGRNWTVMYDLLEVYADQVKLAHPKKVKAIASAKIKTDTISSEVLAHLLRANLIPEAHVASPEVRHVRNVLRQRMFYVRVRTMVKNRIHALVDRHPEIKRSKGMKADLFGKAGTTWLREAPFPGETRKLLDAELQMLEALNIRIGANDVWIKELAKDNEQAALLQTIPGIGRFFSLLLSAEIDGIERFASPKKLASYAGLVPSTYSSGGKTFHGRITKEGNKWIRWALVEAVVPAITSDYWLRSLYERKKRTLGTNKAKVAVARKLLTLAYRVLSERRPYQSIKERTRKNTQTNLGLVA